MEPFSLSLQKIVNVHLVAGPLCACYDFRTGFKSALITGVPPVRAGSQPVQQLEPGRHLPAGPSVLPKYPVWRGERLTVRGPQRDLLSSWLSLSSKLLPFRHGFARWPADAGLFHCSKVRHQNERHDIPHHQNWSQISRWQDVWMKRCMKPSQLMSMRARVHPACLPDVGDREAAAASAIAFPPHA